MKSKTNKDERKRLSSPLENNYSEPLQSKRKRKSKDDEEDEKINFPLEDFDSETTKQDNTPESLRKRKKIKKKKTKSQIAIAQPNTYILDYLTKWKNDRSHWKFEKVKQKRLVSNMFENDKLPDDYFAIFLEYMEGGSKSMKELMSKLAREVVEEMEKWESLSEEEKETTPKVNETRYKRARTMLQMLQ